MKCCCLIWLLFVCIELCAQTTPEGIEQQLENITEQSEDAEATDDSWLQQIEYLKNNPLNLNNATADDLNELQILSPLQIENFIAYRTLLGKLISIYELQAIPEWDITLILKLLPFISVSKAIDITDDFKHRLSKGTHTFFIRYSRAMEKGEGYNRKDSSKNFYAGNPSRVMIRYKYQYKNLFQYGLTGSKDAGEPFFNGRSNMGFDFYSFHLFAKNIGIIKTIAIGDYTVNMGQGLILWQGLAFGKGGEAINIKRQSPLIKPYNSAGAFYFNRGAAITIEKNKWQTTLFGSLRKLDANIAITDTIDTEIVSSIHQSGYHRTQTEIEDKGALSLFSYGGNIRYTHGRWQAGINMVQYQFNKPIQKKAVPYNLFAITGNNWSNYSIDYSYTFKNMHLFGEYAIDKNGKLALMNGILISADKRADISIMYRRISPSYQTVYGNAFTINTLPTNERGLYMGLTLRPVNKIKLNAYADLFSFPWLKYRVDAPSRGQEYSIQLSYTAAKHAEVYTRFRIMNKPLNNTTATNALNETANFSNRSWRTQINYQINASWTIRHRFEILWYSREKLHTEKGYLTFFDIFFKPAIHKFGVNARLQYFESDSYNSRLYAYENDVLYYYAVPVFFDAGLRYYFNIKYNIAKFSSLWLKWAQSIYSNKTSVGSGLDEIAGNKKSEIRLLVSVNF